MIRRYLSASLKKNPGRSLFPLLVLMFLNTILFLGTACQQYCFCENSNFVSLRNTAKDSGQVFAPYTLPFCFVHSPETEIPAGCEKTG